MDSADTITDVKALIDRLGGPAEAGRTLGGISGQRVWNWGEANKMPSDLYLEHRAILLGLGITCADALWFGERVPQPVGQQAGAR